MKENMQTDLFGNEVPISETVKSITGKRESIKDIFRKMHGFNDDHICKECRNVLYYRYNNKVFYKCAKIGISSSSATDIRLKDKSCDLFEGRIEECLTEQ